MEEIEGFFRDGIPARQWSIQPRSQVLADGNFNDFVEKG